MIKLIIFDWDDVITLGAKEAYFACYHNALIKVGVYLSTEEEKKRIMAKWSKPFQEELKELLQEHPELLDRANQEYLKEADANFVSYLRVRPQTNSLLINLKSSYTLAVATGNHTERIKQKIMPHFRIPDVFSQILSSHDIDDPEKTKPHPLMLEMIMKKHSITPAETVYVGDAKTDVQMANNARVVPIVVLTGHLSKKEAEDLKVEHIIKDVTQLENVLTKINKNSQSH